MSCAQRRPERISEDIQDVMVALVPSLLVPFVPAVGMAEDTEHAISAVLVAIVRALNLGHDPLFTRITIPAVVESVILEPVARDLRRNVRPVEIVGPVLRLGRVNPPARGQREGQG